MPGNHTPTTNTPLLARLAAANDDDAWSTFLSRYRPLIDGWCARRLRPCDADEVASAVWCKLVHQMRVFAYDRRKGRFRGWLCRLVQNEVNTHLRRAGQFDPLPPDYADPASLADDLGERIDRDLTQAEEIAARVRRRVEPHNWQAFWRVVVEGRAPAEAARELGLTLHAVCQARRRIVRMLHEERRRAFPEEQP